jgi:calcineurin-like phosphoesterase family protein
MAHDIWVISDTHLGHDNILKFLRSDGTPLRPFSSIEEMHHTIMSNWNKVVKPQDKVYHLGDVAFKDWALNLLKGANGHKRLVKGNHDRFKIGMYLDIFEKIEGVCQIDGVWMSHVPMHEAGVNQPRVLGNVHGHLHAHTIDHPKYFNASVECINYTPVNLEEIRDFFKKRCHKQQI